MAFIMAALKQQRSKKKRGHINQAAISPWLSNNRAESSIQQEQRKQEILSQLAALGFRCRMQSWTFTRLLGALTQEPGGSRESSTAAH